MEDVIVKVLQPLLQYIVITFMVTEVVKQVAKVFGVRLGKASILISVALGIILSYGWALSVLPEPSQPRFEYVAVFITGLIIAGAAGGLFTWMKNVFPWFEQLNTSST